MRTATVNRYALLGVVLVCGALAATASAAYDPAKAQAHGSYAELAQDPAQVAGGWEYIVDFYTAGGVGSYMHGIWGPDWLYESMTNLNEGAEWYGGQGDYVMQFWDQSAAHGLDDAVLKHPSQDTNYDDEWELTGHPWEIINTWHAPNEYASGTEINHTGPRLDAGTLWDGKVLGQDTVQVWDWQNHQLGSGPLHNSGLWFTLRLVTDTPLPSLEWSLPSNGPIKYEIDWSESVWEEHPDYVEGLGVDFDQDGVNDVFNENYGIYPIGGNFIPEPATMGMLALGALALLRKRRRSHI
jgi:hypothetical protein